MGQNLERFTSFTKIQFDMDEPVRRSSSDTLIAFDGRKEYHCKCCSKRLNAKSDNIITIDLDNEFPEEIPCTTAKLEVNDNVPHRSFAQKSFSTPLAMTQKKMYPEFTWSNTDTKNTTNGYLKPTTCYSSPCVFNLNESMTSVIDLTKSETDSLNRSHRKSLIGNSRIKKHKIYQKKWKFLKDNFNEFRYSNTTLMQMDELRKIAKSLKQQQQWLEQGVRLRPITNAETERIEASMKMDELQVLMRNNRFSITTMDIKTLLPDQWLNDQIINFYLSLIVQRSEKYSETLPEVFAMDSFFIPRLMKKGYEGVRRWTGNTDIFSKDFILIPENYMGTHWVLNVVDFTKRQILRYDSLPITNHHLLETLLKYLCMESIDKRNIEFDRRGFQVGAAINIPQQRNSFDCGVFTSMFAEYLTRNKELNFSQNDMPYFRNKMILEILDGEIWN